MQLWSEGSSKFFANLKKRFPRAPDDVIEQALEENDHHGGKAGKWLESALGIEALDSRPTSFRPSSASSTLRSSPPRGGGISPTGGNRRQQQSQAYRTVSDNLKRRFPAATDAQIERALEQNDNHAGHAGQWLEDLLRRLASDSSRGSLAKHELGGRNKASPDRRDDHSSTQRPSSAGSTRRRGTQAETTTSTMRGTQIFTNLKRRFPAALDKEIDSALAANDNHAGHAGQWLEDLLGPLTPDRAHGDRSSRSNEARQRGKQEHTGGQRPPLPPPSPTGSNSSRLDSPRPSSAGRMRRRGTQTETQAETTTMKGTQIFTNLKRRFPAALDEEIDSALSANDNHAGMASHTLEALHGPQDLLGSDRTRGGGGSPRSSTVADDKQARQRGKEGRPDVQSQRPSTPASPQRPNSAGGAHREHLAGSPSVTDSPSESRIYNNMKNRCPQATDAQIERALQENENHAGRAGQWLEDHLRRLARNNSREKERAEKISSESAPNPPEESAADKRKASLEHRKRLAIEERKKAKAELARSQAAFDSPLFVHLKKRFPSASDTLIGEALEANEQHAGRAGQWLEDIISPPTSPSMSRHLDSDLDRICRETSLKFSDNVTVMCYSPESLAVEEYDILSPEVAWENGPKELSSLEQMEKWKEDGKVLDELMLVVVEQSEPKIRRLLSENHMLVPAMTEIAESYMDWIEMHPDGEIKASPNKWDISIRTKRHWAATLNRLEICF